MNQPSAAVPRDGKFHVDPLNPMISVRYLKAWFPPRITEAFSGGITARLGHFPDGSVLKFLVDRDDKFANWGLNVEHRILLALGEHQRVVKYLGKDTHGLRFTFASHCDLRRYMLTHDGGTPSVSLRQKWVSQAVESLVFVHSKGVIHCDIHPSNFLVDENLNLRICDFSGSLFGELDGGAMESTRYFLQREPLSTPNERSDFFALGSTIYYIMTDHDPYETLPAEEVTLRYLNGNFPDVTGIGNGELILACWKGLSDAQKAELLLRQDINSN